jgi:hypothetical protein
VLQLDVNPSCLSQYLCLFYNEEANVEMKAEINRLECFLDGAFNAESGKKYE